MIAVILLERTDMEIRWDPTIDCIVLEHKPTKTHVEFELDELRGIADGDIDEYFSYNEDRTILRITAKDAKVIISYWEEDQI